jgi:hypothetical protein
MNENIMNNKMNGEIPDYAMIPAVPASETPAKLIPATDDLKSTRLRLSGVHTVNIPDITIEEDILVPDTRPDLEKIVSITAVPEVSSHESYIASNGSNMFKISGNFEISTLYLPADSRTELVSITSHVPFRRETEVEEPVSNTAEIDVRGSVIQSKVINERKIRISAGASFTVHEYGENEIELLEGVRDDSLLLKKDTIRFTDMAQQRTDTTDIKEKIRIKDSLPAPERILRYDVNAVENHRQLSRGKAVVEGSLYYSILYLPETEEDTDTLPVYMRGKSEFTQFLRLPEMNDEETAGSIVKFEILKSDISLRDPNSTYNDTDSDEADSEDETSDDRNTSPYFLLNASLATSIQVYRNIEREVVTDMYHRSRDLEFSTAPYEISELCGSTATDISVRDTVTIPDNQGSAASVPYIDVRVGSITTTAETDRCIVEGNLDISILFSDETTGEVSCCDAKVPFRAVTDMSGVCSTSRIECVPGIKDIWFDKINSHQVDFNCSLSVRVCAWNVTLHEFIDKVCYIEDGSGSAASQGIVVYMTKPDDTQWSVSKKFRTTVEALRDVNGLEENQPLTEGTRLLIV